MSFGAPALAPAAPREHAEHRLSAGSSALD